MNSLDSENGLSDVEPTLLLAEDILFHQQGHQVASLKKLHDEVKVLLILEGALEFNDPVVLGKGKNVSLSPHMRHLILIDHFSLLHLLYSNDL